MGIGEVQEKRRGGWTETSSSKFDAVSRPRAFLVFFLIESSSASSNTKFMYSSNPCELKHKRDQHTLLDNIPLRNPLVLVGSGSHNDTPLDPHVCVLKQPDLHPCFLPSAHAHRALGARGQDCRGLCQVLQRGMSRQASGNR